MNLFDVLLLILSGVMAWLATILFTRVKAKFCNLYLALCITAAFLYILRSVLYFNQMYLEHEYLLFIPIYWSASFGPIFYLYFRYIVYDQDRLRSRDLVHFIPFFLQFGFHLYWFLQPFPEKLAFYQESYAGAIAFYEQLIALPLAIVYLVLSFRSLSRYVKTFESSFSRETIQILWWARTLAMLFIMLMTLWTVYVILIYFTPGYRLPQYAYYPYFSAVTFLSLWMAHKVFRYPAITLEHLTFIRSSAKDEEFERKLKALAVPRMFDLELGPYPMEELASLLSVEVTYLSTYLRIHFNVNYPAWVRNYRMQEFRRLALKSFYSERKIRVNELQRQCGYLNRGSFNRDVKEAFAHSPSEYLEKINKYGLHKDNGVEF